MFLDNVTYKGQLGTVSLKETGEKFIVKLWSKFYANPDEDLFLIVANNKIITRRNLKKDYNEEETFFS